MNKKLTVKRVVIFCVLSFVPFWIIIPILNSVYGGPVYAVESAYNATYLLGIFGMLIPAAANLITRLVTKEGWKDSYLGLNLKGNGKYYAAAVLVILAEDVVAALLICRVFLKEYTLEELFSGGSISWGLPVLLVQLAYAIILFFPSFGEEWGWRGYLGPKLKELIGMPASVIVGGIIWGLWHAPLTIAGHNFGIGYSFYPWLGIGYMCIMCIVMNAFLTLLTERTKSIYPASFCHMVFDIVQPEILFLLFAGETGQKAFTDNLSDNTISWFPIFLIPLAVTGIISFLLLIRKGNSCKSDL